MPDEQTSYAGALRYPRRWPLYLDRLVSFAIRPGDRADTIRTKRLFVAAMWASVLASSVSIYQFLSFVEWAHGLGHGPSARTEEVAIGLRDENP